MKKTIIRGAFAIIGALLFVTVAALIQTAIQKSIVSPIPTVSSEVEHCDSCDGDDWCTCVNNYLKFSEGSEYTEAVDVCNHIHSR